MRAPTENPGRRGAALAVFSSLFAAQAGLVAISPVLVQIGREFGVSTASVGQLRTVAGIVAVVTALALGLVSGRVGPRALLVSGLGLLAASSALGAAATSLAVLGVAQAATGAAVAVLTVAATAAAGEWGGAGDRSRLLSIALIGQAASWVIGMPLIGVLGSASWRLALAVPLASAAAAAVAVLRGPSSPPAAVGGGVRAALAVPGLRRWAVGEVLAYSAWTGTIVYAGALLVETYRASLTATGIALAVAGAAYVPGNALARRLADRHGRRLLVWLGLLAAVTVAAFGAARPGFWESAAIFALLGFLAGARTLAGSAYGLQVAPDHKLGAMSVRAATLYGGYLVGGALGGGALALGGYGAVGLVFAALFAAGTAPHLLAARRARAAGPRAALAAEPG